MLTLLAVDSDAVRMILSGTWSKWVTRPIVLLSLLGYQLGGCSYIFSEGPPPDYRGQRDFDCSGYAAPVLDTVWAALNGIGALSAGGTSDEAWARTSHPASKSTTVASGLSWLLISGTSAIYGYTKANECSEAHKEMDRPITSSRPPWPLPDRTKPPLPAPGEKASPAPSSAPLETPPQ